MRKKLVISLLAAAVLLTSTMPAGTVYAAASETVDAAGYDDGYWDDSDDDYWDDSDDDYWDDSNDDYWDDDEDYWDDEDDYWDDEEDEYIYEEGDVFTAENGYEYEITSIDYDSETGEVALAGCESSNITRISVPTSVDEENYTFDVTEISEEAFEGYRRLKTLTISNSVYEIGDGAFANCTSLTSVTIGKNLTTIGLKAFYRDTKLKSVKINSKRIRSISSSAFKSIYKRCEFRVPSTKLKTLKKIIQKSAGKKTILRRI